MLVADVVIDDLEAFLDRIVPSLTDGDPNLVIKFILSCISSYETSSEVERKLDEGLNSLIRDTTFVDDMIVDIMDIVEEKGATYHSRIRRYMGHRSRSPSPKYNRSRGRSPSPKYRSRRSRSPSRSRSPPRHKRGRSPSPNQQYPNKKFRDNNGKYQRKPRIEKADQFKKKSELGDDDVSLLVLQIPLESLNEETVRPFFEKFGTVVNILLPRLPEFQRAALVTFSNHQEAMSAYTSQEAILNNRFVLTKWPSQVSLNLLENRPRTLGDDENASKPQHKEKDNAVVVEKKKVTSEELRFDAKADQIKSIKAKYEGLLDAFKAKANNPDLSKEERLAAAQKARMIVTKLNDMAPKPTTPVVANPNDMEAIEAKFNALKSEAESLGVDTNTSAPRGRGRGRGRPIVVDRSAFKLDLRTAAIRVSAPQADLESLKTHFTQFGTVKSISSDNGDVIVEMDARGHAEHAMAKGQTLGEEQLGLHWTTLAKPQPSKEEATEPVETMEEFAAEELEALVPVEL